MSLIDENEGLPRWASQDAKAKLPDLVRKASRQDQLITKRDEPVAVVVSKKRYDELTKKSGSLLDFFKNSPLPEVEITIKRNKDLPREIEL